jgi:hypothetical protein
MEPEGGRPVSRIALLLFALLLPAVGRAQCILADPSFEVGGGGGAVFGGWSQFGPVGSHPDAPHGAAAARVTGPDQGGWDVAAFWQRLDTVPGDTWDASVRVWHSAAHPLTGQSRAILNIEWRDAGGTLISYESHTAADGSTPPGSIRTVSVTSGPAPAGAAGVRLLLGVLQAPGEPPPDVYYDEATFAKTGPPGPDDLQWTDFPGGRTVDFGGRSWRVKGPGFYAPGPSWFSDGPDAVWVDAQGGLHLTIRDLGGGSWASTEVVLEDALGYGDYVFTTSSRVDALDLHAILGLFLWEYGPCYDPANAWWNPYNEIDVEIGRWGDPGRDAAQFVAQPYDWPGNLTSFDPAIAGGETTSWAFRWLPDRVEFRAWRGGPADETPGNLLSSWTYTGPHVPRPEQPRVHLNLWQFDGPPTGEQEVVIDAFTFVPDGAVVSAPAVPPRAASSACLVSVDPNPFRLGTSVRYSLAREGVVEVTVHDVTGRLVRRLASGPAAAGGHSRAWDGRDAAGRRAASGVYWVRLRAGDDADARRVVLLR